MGGILPREAGSAKPRVQIALVSSVIPSVIEL